MALREWMRSRSQSADLLDMTEAQLQKVNKDEIIAFLKENEYDFDTKAPKDELIKIVLGEE